MPQNTNPQYPSTKPTWDISELQAGGLGSKDPAALEITRDVGQDGIEFGTFVNFNTSTDKVEKIAAADTDCIGPALISNLADDYANRKYNTDDKCALGRRGYFLVKFQLGVPKPTPGGTVRISNGAGTEGYLTASATNSKVADKGITIEAVYDTVAEIYLEGKGVIALT
jgi:hypothetical protein